ncbi:MAG: 4Fe-4S dicluster domain-containing protein [Thermoleophilia bacterium]
MSILPAHYPPPFASSDYVIPPAAAEDERIEVGVLIVGAGPGGLATAVRLGQLLAEDEALMEQLGEVPIAVADKGKGPGSHLLSGAVMRPGPIKALFPDVDDADIPHYDVVSGESVYFMLKNGKVRIPTPPQMKNHGNWVVSISQLGRWMSEQAEELGAFMLPETDCQKLLVESGRVMGVLTGDKGRGKEGEQLAAFEPGAEVHAKVTVIAEGTAGHLAGVIRKHFDLDRDSTQIWELGVKEVWRVQKPLTKVIHTLGWPLRLRTKYREYGGSWIYPMGPDMVSLGYVAGLDYADATLSVHDVLQEFKTHPFIRSIIEDGERLAWGAKTIPGGGLYGLPSRMHVPGAVLVGDSAGFVDMMALKGVHNAIHSGMIAAESIYAALKAGKATDPAGLWGYTKGIRDSQIWKDLWKVRNIRPAFQKGFIYGGMIHGMATGSFGHAPRKPVRFKPDAKEPVFIGSRNSSYPKPDGKYVFDKLGSVFASGNATRDDQPSHIRIQQQVPLELATTWEWMCPAKVYEIAEGGPAADGTVTVHVNPSNCVQCGAITAKGGRLTPPEGGSGPEYTLT